MSKFERRDVQKVSPDAYQEYKDEHSDIDIGQGIDRTHVWGYELSESANRVLRMKELGAPTEIIQSLESQIRPAIDREVEGLKRLAARGRARPLVRFLQEVKRNRELYDAVYAASSPDQQELLAEFDFNRSMRALSALFDDPDAIRETRIADLRMARKFWLNAEFPSNVWRSLIDNHVSEFERCAAELKRPEVQGAIRSAVQAIYRGIRAGTLPITKERADAAFKRLKEGGGIVVADDLDPNMELIGGYYHDWADAVGISYAELDSQSFSAEDLETLLVHEFRHLLSGKTAVAFQETFLLDANEQRELRARHGESDAKEPLEYEPQPGMILVRGGLRFARNDLHGPKDKYAWLDEAVIVRGTDRLLPRHASRGYPEYCRILDYLMHAGRAPVAFELFEDALLENYEPGKPNQLWHWRTLRIAINEAHDPKILSTLDTIIRTQGDLAGVKWIKEKYPNYQSSVDS